MPTVSGIAERAEIGVMRGGDDRMSPGNQQAMNLLHRSHDVFDVFKNVRGADFAERIVTEGEVKTVEIGYNVRICTQVSVNTDRIRKFIDTAANVQN
jgi:hypothetical protein